jgi:hypothetical protein
VSFICVLTNLDLRYITSLSPPKDSSRPQCRTRRLPVNVARPQALQFHTSKVLSGQQESPGPSIRELLLASGQGKSRVLKVYPKSPSFATMSLCLEKPIGMTDTTHSIYSRTPACRLEEIPTTCLFHERRFRKGGCPPCRNHIGS